MKPMVRLVCAALGVAALGLSANVPANAQSIYVSDFLGKMVKQFQATATPNPPVISTISTAPNSAQALGYYGTTLVVSEGLPAGGYVINKYNMANNALIGGIGVADAAYDMVVLSDGSAAYITQGNAVSKVDLSTGAILASFADANMDPWGIAKNPLTGEYYVAEGWSTGANAVYKYDANLTSRTAIVAPTNDAARGFAGITFKDDGTFYVLAGGNVGTPSTTDAIIYHYDAAGNLLGTLNAPAGDLLHGFDVATGLDGNIYATSFIGACAVRFDGMTNLFMDAYIGPHPDGLASAKSMIFVPGASAVPEPGTIALFVGMGVSGATLIARRRRK